MKNNLYILTAATPRPELHCAGLFPFIEKLKEESFWDVTWLVNLDKPDFFSEEDMNLSKKLFWDMNALCVVNEENPSFALAGKNLFTRCMNIVSENSMEENVFLWLEDDWAIHEHDMQEFIFQTKRLFTTDRTCVLGCIPNRVCGNPFSFVEGLLFKIMEIYERTDKILDPEIAIMEGQRLYEAEHLGIWPPLDYHSPPTRGVGWDRSLFVDVGRSWRKINDIGKESRFSELPYTWFTGGKGVTKE